MGIFGKKSETKNRASSTTVVAKDTNITGELKLDCDIQVDGYIEGKVNATYQVFVSTSGRIKGDVHADKMIINGRLEGSCYANTLEILENGYVEGSVYCDDFSIEKGGRFVGNTYPPEELSSTIKVSSKNTTKEDSTKNQVEKKNKEQKPEKRILNHSA